ncbi:restriction endonuclease subunit S [Paenibacillus lactis]|uniref:restriction endonuclease subunit S n=1 Tax=Paenibacillus lactis TaxID=228574 RepID=UPI003D75C03C
MKKSFCNLKNSELEWLKEIPSHWKKMKLKHVFNNLDFKRIPLSSEERGSMINKEYDYYGASGVIDKVENYLFNESLILIGEDGANLYSRSTPLAFVAEGKYWVNNHAHILKPKNGNIYYWANLLETIDYTIYITGSAQPKLTQEALANILLPVPPLEEQENIWGYLGSKLMDLDIIIKSKKRLINLLEEKRQSMISEAVTKGLNPNVKMKDSGVEWIGEIPEHWDTNKIKYKFEIVKRILPSEELTVLSLTQKGLKVKDLNDFSGQHAESYEKYQRVEINDYVMNGMDLLTGYVDCSKLEGVTSPDYRVFRLRNASECHGYYLRYFQMCYFSKIFYGHGQGVSNFGRWRLQTDVFKEFPISVPPVCEQYEISKYLNTKEIEINKLIENIKEQIQKLEEYRQSLIYEAVTGKIDVRDFEVVS